MTHSTPDDLVVIGKIISFHGLKGVLKVRPASQPADWAGKVTTIYTKQADSVWKTLSITKAQHKSPLVWLQFEGYPDRTSVEPLKGFDLWASKPDLPQPDEEEGIFWADDLVGLTVIDHATGEPLGKVNDLLSSTGQDYLDIALSKPEEPASNEPSKAPTADKDTLTIPFIEHFFPIVDMTNGVIHLANLDGWSEVKPSQLS